MITFFTIPKPFVGAIGTIQLNAIASWATVAPRAEVLVLGDEPGAAAAAAEVGATHVAGVARNEHGTPRLDAAFRAAGERRANDLLCYVNADIILPQSLAGAAEAARTLGRPFLVVGECWNAKVTEQVDARSLDWPAVLRDARKRGADAIDYFLFSDGVYDEIPPFAVGRTVFDNWLIWRARTGGAAVVDATWTVRPVHQDHAYEHAGSLDALRAGPEAAENRRLTGGGRERLYSRFDATHRTLGRRVVPNPLGIGHAGETIRRGWAKLGYMTGARRS